MECQFIDNMTVKNFKTIYNNKKIAFKIWRYMFEHI